MDSVDMRARDVRSGTIGYPISHRILHFLTRYVAKTRVCETAGAKVWTSDYLGADFRTAGNTLRVDTPEFQPRAASPTKNLSQAANAAVFIPRSQGWTLARSKILTFRRTFISTLIHRKSRRRRHTGNYPVIDPACIIFVWPTGSADV
jgi:hypothetical protein